MVNISEGQLLRTQSTTGMAPSVDQNQSQNVNERIMRQFSDLEAKYTESQMPWNKNKVYIMFIAKCLIT